MSLESNKMMKILCIIPARGGSKGIPGKNLIKILGKTLIQYAYNSTISAHSDITRVLSSDDSSILEHGKQLGLEIIERPKNLAKDDSPVVSAVKHCLDEMEKKKNVKFDLIVLLQPTSPIRTSQDLENIIKMFESPEVEGVISVVSSNEMHPARMYHLNENQLKSLIQKSESSRRQEIEPVYYRNGCYYAVRRDVFLEQKTLMPHNKQAYIMPWERLCNIDEPVDLIVAKALINAWNENII